MLLYEKKIIYLSLFQDGIRKSSAGFLRLSKQREALTLDIHIKSLEEFWDGKHTLFLSARSREIEWGTIKGHNGRADAQRSFVIKEGFARFGEEEFRESDLCGVVIHLDEHRWIAGYWQKAERVFGDPGQGELSAAENVLEDIDTKGNFDTFGGNKGNDSEDIYLSERNVRNSRATGCSTKEKTGDCGKTTNAADEKAVDDREAAYVAGRRTEDGRETTYIAGRRTGDSRETTYIAGRKTEDSKIITYVAGGRKEDGRKIAYVAEKNTEDGYKNTQYERGRNQEGGQINAGEISQIFPEPASEDKWEQLQRCYKKVHPFGDERVFISVEPKDFIILQAPYQRLVNNSFLLHGFYNYKHMILGPDKEIGNGNESCFYLGVPGTYFEREKMVAIMFGFEGFECEGAVEIGKFGYYMRRVEL